MSPRAVETVKHPVGVNPHIVFGGLHCVPEAQRSRKVGIGKEADFSQRCRLPAGCEGDVSIRWLLT
jgi:hypothetical protein